MPLIDKKHSSNVLLINSEHSSDMLLIDREPTQLENDAKCASLLKLIKFV